MSRARTSSSVKNAVGASWNESETSCIASSMIAFGDNRQATSRTYGVLLQWSSVSRLIRHLEPAVDRFGACRHVRLSEDGHLGRHCAPDGPILAQKSKPSELRAAARGPSPDSVPGSCPPFQVFARDGLPRDFQLLEN